MNDKTNFLWQVFTAVNGWVTFADTKATALLTANGVIAALVFANLQEIIKHFNGFSCAAAFAILALLALLKSIIFAMECLLPRLTLNPSKLAAYVFSKKPLHEPTSSLFFDHIAQLSIDEYELRVQAMLSEPEAIKQISQQIHMNSRVASRKYRYVALSAWSFTSALVLGVTSLIFLVLQGAV